VSVKKGGTTKATGYVTDDHGSEIQDDNCFLCFYVSEKGLVFKYCYNQQIFYIRSIDIIQVNTALQCCKRSKS